MNAEWLCRVIGHTRDYNSISVETSTYIETYCGRCGVETERRMKPCCDSADHQ